MAALNKFWVELLTPTFYLNASVFITLLPEL